MQSLVIVRVRVVPVYFLTARGLLLSLRLIGLSSFLGLLVTGCDLLRSSCVTSGMSSTIGGIRKHGID